MLAEDADLHFWDRVRNLFDSLIGRNDEALTALQSIAREFGIEILEILTDTQSKSGNVTHSNTKAFQFQTACELLISELSIYSTSVIKVSKLKRIELGSNLRVHGSEAAGAFNAIDGVIYFSTQPLHDLNYGRRAFHHELFHCIDYIDDFWKYLDPDWHRLNASDFSYSSTKYKNKQLTVVHRLGFMTNYSMTEVREDKAELYAYMIVHYDAVMAASEQDVILGKKIVRMKELLAHLSKDYDDNFWLQRSRSSTPLPQRDETITSFKIWGEQISSGETWFLASLGSSKPPVAFRSPDQLLKCIEELGAIDFGEMNKLVVGKNLHIKIRVANSVLTKFGLR